MGLSKICSVTLWMIVCLTFCTTSAYEIWPHPKVVNPESSFYTVNPHNFTISLKTNGKCELLEKALPRFHGRTFVQDCSKVNGHFKGHFFSNDQEDFRHNEHYLGQLDDLVIKVDEPCETMPHDKMNEKYSIEILKQNPSMIHSPTVWGALRALETLSQMMERTGKDQFKIHLGTVHDEPRFSFRGLLIDTSRHYIPLRSIYDTLDAMEMNKLNVLHWHIVDDQSFPFVSESFPELSKKGAYRHDYIYDVQDVNNVIEYARQRAIRVIPEFDTPGHTESWGKGQTDLLTPCYDSKGKPNHQFGPINPILNSTYTFVDKFFHEIAHRFPEKYLHLGGDEVSFECWKSNPEIKKFMEQEHFGEDYAKLESYYITKLIDIVQKLNRSYIVWQEVFDNKVAIRPETVVHVWKSNLLPTWQTEVKNVTKAGYQVLVSSCWYLNYISYGVDWYKYYQCDPQQFNGTEQERKLVIGGEACMWGEYVDASNLISRTWPRACAVAERLWSEEKLKDHNKAKPRFHRQRCRMQERGLRVEPASGPDFCWCDNAL